MREELFEREKMGGRERGGEEKKDRESDGDRDKEREINNCTDRWTDLLNNK